MGTGSSGILCSLKVPSGASDWSYNNKLTILNDAVIHVRPLIDDKAGDEKFAKAEWSDKAHILHSQMCVHVTIGVKTQTKRAPLEHDVFQINQIGLPAVGDKYPGGRGGVVRDNGSIAQSDRSVIAGAIGLDHIGMVIVLSCRLKIRVRNYDIAFNRSDTFARLDSKSC